MAEPTLDFGEPNERDRAHDAVVTAYANLESALNQFETAHGPGRELSLAKTNAEQSRLWWASKHAQY